MKKKKTSISLERTTLKKIKTAARRDRRSVSSWVELELEKKFAKPPVLSTAEVSA